MLKTALPLFFIFFICAAQAAPLAPFNMKGEYGFTWMHLPFGRLTVDAAEEGGRYRIASTIESVRAGKIFSDHRSTATAEGDAAVPAENASRSFESRYDTKDGTSHVRLVFTSGRLKERIVETPEPVGKRPIVPEDNLEGALDFLSFARGVRQHLRAALDAGKSGFEVRLYEGKRLMNTVWTVQGKKKIRWNGKSTPVIACTAKREAVDGFTAKEQKRIAKGEPPLTVYFSDDEKLIPLALRLDAWFGVLEAVLKGDMAN